tara:strand:- start:11164 stop:11484 length:321 start_codon:yes stop_codon:yes gene_type:complete
MMIYQLLLPHPHIRADGFVRREALQQVVGWGEFREAASKGLLILERDMLLKELVIETAVIQSSPQALSVQLHQQVPHDPLGLCLPKVFMCVEKLLIGIVFGNQEVL